MSLQQWYDINEFAKLRIKNKQMKHLLKKRESTTSGITKLFCM